MDPDLVQVDERMFDHVAARGRHVDLEEALEAGHVTLRAVAFDDDTFAGAYWMNSRCWFLSARKRKTSACSCIAG